MSVHMCVSIYIWAKPMPGTKTYITQKQDCNLTSCVCILCASASERGKQPFHMTRRSWANLVHKDTMRRHTQTPDWTCPLTKDSLYLACSICKLLDQKTLIPWSTLDGLSAPLWRPGLKLFSRLYLVHWQHGATCVLYVYIHIIHIYYTYNDIIYMFLFQGSGWSTSDLSPM